MAEEDEIVENEEEGQGQGKGKLFLIIGIAVGVLLIGGAAAFFLMGGEEEAAEGEEAVVQEPVEELGPPLYHSIPSAKEGELIVSMPPDGRFKLIQVGIKVFTYSPELVDYLKKNDPQIRHHLINMIAAKDSKTLMTKAGKMDLQQQIKDKMAELISATDNEEEKKLADQLKDVYFTSFIMQ